MEKSIEEIVENDSVEQPMVSFLVHENDMNHKDAENERIHETFKRTIWGMCLTFLLIIAVFVAAYTIRTRIWNQTIERMTNAIIEVAQMHHQCAEVENAEKPPTP